MEKMSTQFFEEFMDSSTLYEDGNMVVDGNLVGSREEALEPLHSNVYVS